ncbi:MAG: HipA N-terminal domain-containing protein [Acidobacteriota bacterium]|nr:HipA N-terminal domain-containing protein [Acidobacteriota bacterium]
MKLSVRLYHGDTTVEVGVLLARDRRIFFEYDAEFLNTKWDLSPFHLPRGPGVFKEKRRVFGGLHGLFYDALPDGWGLLSHVTDST